MNVALDCDGVLSNFSQALIEKANEMGLGEFFPKSWMDIDSWDFSPKFSEVWKVIEKDEGFWLGIEPFKDTHGKVDFTPIAYVTARPVPSSTTRFWLRANGFPDAPVHTVHPNASKLDILRDIGVDLFVDDKPETVEELNDNGLLCLMFSRPHNVKHKTKYPVIKSLAEIKKYLNE